MNDANSVVREADGRVGQLLCGKWRLERLLGIGGMGAVYAARHVRNQSRVAIKILHRHAGLSPERVARLQREGYVANRIGHDGVPAVYDDDIDEHGCPFLILELLSGQSVAQQVTNAGGRLPARTVLEIADAVLDVLAASHACSILHRDIKPDNLFITDQGELKVLDFGIARLCDPEMGSEVTENGTLLGSPGFLPPEQARGQLEELDSRTDLWALGATMFTLLTGRFVHEAKTPNERLGLAMTASAPSLARIIPELPPAIAQIVDRALAFDRAKRWPDARTMQQAVQAALHAAPDQANIEASAPTESVERARRSAAASTHRPPTLRDGGRESERRLVTRLAAHPGYPSERFLPRYYQSASSMRELPLRVLKDGEVRTNDGVAIVARGDTLSIVYQAPARLHRSRFLYDAADQLAARNPEGILSILVVLPTADMPDATTRAENAARLRRLGPALRKLVTVPIGDMFRIRLVRTIMRGLAILHGQAHCHSISSTVDEGLSRLFEAAGPRTPSIPQLEADLRAICCALEVEALPMRTSRRSASTAL